MTEFVVHADCLDFISTLEDQSVHLFLIDPPYYQIVKDSWDNQWSSPTGYVKWLYSVFEAIKPKMTLTGSVIFFGGIGKHREHPFFNLLDKIEEHNLFYFRNMITWAKRRAYGKSHDYLFCREEIAWYSVSPIRTEITFNIPLTETLRGYKGFNKKYPAKSDYKRVSNVWTDIPELMRPSRTAEKPINLINRLIETHSDPGQLVVDCFAGSGSTAFSALKLQRRFLGCEIVKEDAEKANLRCCEISNEKQNVAK